MSEKTANPIVKYFSEFGVMKDCGKDFWLTIVIQFFDGLGYFCSINYFALFLIRYCGFTDAASTFWVGMFTLLLSLFIMAVGTICDIIGLKRTYAIGFTLLILGRSIMTWGTDFGMSFMGLSQNSSGTIVIGGIVMMSFGMAFMSPCISTSIRRFTTLRSRATGFNFYYLFMNVGAITATAIVAETLMQKYGPTTGLLVVLNVGTISHAIAFIVTRFINENFYAVPEEKVNKDESSSRRPLQLIGEVIREKPFQRLLLFLFLTLGVRMVFTLQFLVMAQYYTRTIGDDFSLGYINSINPFIIIFGLIVLIPIINRFSTVNLMIYGMSISAFSLVFMAIPPELYLYIPGIDTIGQAYFVAVVTQIVIFAFGELIFSPRFYEYVSRVAPKDKVASYMSLSGLPMFIAKPINGVVGGILLSYYCYDGIAAKIDSGHIDFWNSPEFMWTLYLMMAVVSPVAIIATKRMFTASIDEAESPAADAAAAASEKEEASANA